VNTGNIASSGQARGRRRRWLFVATVAVVVAAASALTVILSLPRPGQADEDAIKAVLISFAAAVDSEDQRGMLLVMCQEEAAEMTDSGDYEPDAPPVSLDPSSWKPPDISDVRVVGDVASANVIRASTASMLYLRKVSGNWRVCAPAADEIPAGRPS
jgi:hypothetical protein